VFCSIDRIDLVAQLDGKPIAVQTDHRACAAILAEPELSTLFAMARVLNAQTQLADDGHPGAAVHYVLADEPTAVLRAALAAVGGVLERADHVVRRLEVLGPASAARAGELADRSFVALARRVAARVGSRDLAIALRMLEDQTVTAPPERDDELGYWSRVLELAALAGELLRAKHPGRWVQTDRALVPFGFQLDAGEPRGSLVLFPTNRAQRVIEDGRGETLFKLLVAADETVEHPSDPAHGRLMPSLRNPRDVELDEVVWRPVLADDADADLPIIVCGLDGESTFGMLRREALARPVDVAHAEALHNLAAETVESEPIEVGELPVMVVSGSFYAAEKLIDRAFMLGLHRALGCELLYAAAPSRGVLLAAPALTDVTGLARFAQLVRLRHDEGGSRAISPAVLLIKGGVAIAHVRGDETGAGNETGSSRADTVPNTPTRAGLLRRLLGRK
jgi:hypothetical protein